MKRVRAVIPSWNTRELLLACLRTLEPAVAQGLEVVVVDDGSADGSPDAVARAFPRVRLVACERSGGFSRACNQGLVGLDRPYALFLNADAEIELAALGALVDFLEASPSYGAAAPRLASAEGATLRALMRFPRLRTALYVGTPLERLRPRARELERYFARDLDPEVDADVEQPPAACLLARSAALRSAGSPAFDERMRTYFSDVDLSLRLARAGWRTRYLARARALHHVGQSTRQLPDRILEWHLDRLAFHRKHDGWIAGPWLKACALFAAAGFVGEQMARKARGAAAEPIAPVVRALPRLMAR